MTEQAAQGQAGRDQAGRDPAGQDRDWDWADRDWAAEDPDPGAAEAAAPDDAYAAIDTGDWLADAPPELWDDPAGWTGDGEAFAAGFLHHDPGGRFATGLACGGELDVLAPGPALAGFLAAATAPAGGGHAALGESELIGALCAWQRIAAWAAAGQAAAITTLCRRRAAQSRERDNPHLAGHVTDEVAAALVLTGRAASVLAEDAAGLARLPQVHAALAAGAIDWRRAVIFGAELASLHDHDATAIAAAVVPAAGRLTTSQIRRLLRRAVADHDPAAARRRAAAAAADAAVQAWTETSGNAALAGRELPEADVITADRRLSALARWLADRGAPGTVDQLRAAVFTALLTGRPVQSLLPPDMPRTEGPSPAGDGAPPVTGTVHLTVPLTTWAGLTARSGEVAGHGPVTADTSTALATALAASPATRWCLTLTSPAGQPLAHACAPRGRPPPPGGGPPALAWAAALASQMAVLETAPCQHRRHEDRYQPSAPLAHLIRTRQPACCFPGCARPAARCDLDHTIAWHHGGRTCECNLAPTCRTHHQAKQAPHWHLTQPHPGQLTWTLPSGRTYQPATTGYPA